jgi:hypothetical protein
MNTDVMDVLVAENDRLRGEVRELRERLEAFERSRWQRLNPRKLLRRRPSQQVEALEPPADPVVAPADSTVQRFRDEIVSKGSFSQDWFSTQIASWETLFRDLEGRESRVLEIGSYEGMSACYVLWRLPRATITCVDTFEAAPRIDSYASHPHLEATFDRNIALVDASRVRKLVGPSRKVLADLVTEGSRFDLVYVDGSHLGLDVLVDGALSWQLLEPGGVLVFDDYEYYDHGADPLLRPGPAVDAFLTLLEGKYELLFRGYQLAVRKLGLLTARTPTITS